MEKTIEQKYDALLGAIIIEWWDSRYEFETSGSASSEAVASSLMRILLETATSADILDFILEKQQLRFERL